MDESKGADLEVKKAAAEYKGKEEHVGEDDNTTHEGSDEPTGVIHMRTVPQPQQKSKKKRKVTPQQPDMV